MKYALTPIPLAAALLLGATAAPALATSMRPAGAWHTTLAQVTTSDGPRVRPTWAVDPVVLARASSTSAGALPAAAPARPVSGIAAAPAQEVATIAQPAAEPEAAEELPPAPRLAQIVAAAPAPAPALAAAPAPVAQIIAATPAPAPIAVLAAAPAPRPSTATAEALLAQTSTPAPRPSAAVVDTAAGRFDLSVNNAPAAQVFMQLAQGSRYNMLVAPDLAGSISITLRDVTLTEALESLRDLYGYDFRITGNRIFVHSNAVQTRLFRINYLPGRRQGASDIRVTSSSITQAPAGHAATQGTPGQPTGSAGGLGSRADDNAHVRTTSDSDFWREVQLSLTSMVGSDRGRSVVLNPAAGVVVVRGTPAELRQVEGYLKAVQLSVERQVMIEAKVVEVSLTKDAQSGVNWGAFARSVGSGTLSYGVVAPGTTLGTSGNLISGDGNVLNPAASIVASALGKGFYGLAFQGANFAALLNFLQTQGDVSVLSAPRIATLNNQKAVLKVGSDELYVTGITTSTTTTGTGSVSTPSVQLQPFFSGIALDVTPQIDDAGNVILHVHPTISAVTEKTKNIDLGSLGSYRLPLAASSVNETDSIVRVVDGQIVAIGGLMMQETRDERSGVPVLSEAPVVGGLFRQSGTTMKKREIVILMKPTIIKDESAQAAAAGQPPR